MFCTNCGAAIDQDVISCSQCGVRVDHTPKKGREERNLLVSMITEKIRQVFSPGITHVLAWVCVILSGGSLAIGIFVVVATSLGLIVSMKVPLTDVQMEVNKKNAPTGIEKEIDDLRTLFAHLDDERWTQAKQLISGWAEEFNTNRKDRTLFIAEIKTIATSFPPEQRSAAVDTFYRLKQERRREAILRQQSSWLLQFGTLPAITVSVMVFGMFSLLLALIRIERNTRNIGTTKRLTE